ncbi:MAG: sulfite oxidase [Pseudonocardiaceae bacterium]
MAIEELGDEGTYWRRRAEQVQWQLRRGYLFRRQMLQLMGAGTVVAGLGHAVPPAWADHVAVVKPTTAEFFVHHGTNREMRWEVMAGQGYHTPNHLFYVRNHTATPHIEPKGWKLRIEGSGVRHPIELTYDDLVAMPSVAVTRFLECAGNGRSQFAEAQGQPAAGTPWHFGAIGVAEWEGVALWRVLERAGVKPTAVDVMAEGLDSRRVRRPLPLAKAVADDTLLVYGMNGRALPQDHGFPLRLLVPGWVGVASIKWVGRIEVSETALFSPWNTETYVMIGDAYPERPVLTTQEIKSAFELPWAGDVPAGKQLLTGRSWSAHGRISQVEISTDQGMSWRPATLGRRNVSQAWVQWQIPWDPTAGNHQLRARATDSRGNTQPDTVLYNEQGYLYGAVTDHPVTVIQA